MKIRKEKWLKKQFNKWMDKKDHETRHKIIVKKRMIEQIIRWIKLPFLAVRFLKEQIARGYLPSLDKNMFKTESPLERAMYYDLRRVYKKEEIIPQYPIGNRWADFALPKYMLMIELDGVTYHQDKKKDQIRDAYIRKQGWTIMRFPTWLIEKKPGEAIRKVVNFTQKARESQSSITS
ncbi:Very-short-patch-repair endonuclease [Thermoactinomyces sp. DSM 45891]|uniref:endonuclease domain-containing protein n=1 Tax=Thermoactinomyces sp. DSM 45891 TaxID=1761907 RepID=UPI00091687FA|nr:DUF559 domain-containing protein [Thermoactinomyces sp. DSM 45891]SFX52651.1 Very-short-patch-repair endonuclease [Thermoactinomyces sp. DSM 45891]